MKFSDPKTLRQATSKAVATQAKEIQELALRIHGFAEPAFHEFQSSKALADYLDRHGFEVEFPFKHQPTAFRATWGKRGPGIGMLGEYDALPDCGEKEGAWGHGCGHNLLGTAPAAGAVAAKTLLESNRAPGRIIYYGCPAEETLAGKVYMARDGAFRDLDICLAWHPASDTRVSAGGGAAMDSIVYEFFGRTAHAGGSPHRGRSALDGAVLMDVAANYLWEHVPENVRIHSVIVRGGDAPNVVPAYAKSWYFVRGNNRRQVDEVRERLLSCARGAAEATGTTMKWVRLTAVYERLPNKVLCEFLDQHLRLFGPPRPSPADRKKVQERLGLKPEFDTTIRQPNYTQGRGSSDEANVSWIAPFCKFTLACYIKGTPGHHRDLAAQASLPYAGRAILQSAKVFAATAVALLQDRKTLAAAKREFKKRSGGKPYDPLIPKKQKVPDTLDHQHPAGANRRS